jgi:hypothetical protein
MKKTSIQRWSGLWGIFFLLVVVITNIPAFNDEQGRNFGLYKIDMPDNIVHLLTAIWGIAAAYISIQASIWFFRIFGSVYMLDAIAGLFFSRGLLDLSIFMEGPGAADLSVTNILVNLPHVIISSILLYVGFKGYQKMMSSRT